jgi:predicted RNase H-like HicB family nuclease/uncharacterized damage-inducible protein DinB
MVHVLDLLGCIANGPTTEAALEATPEAITNFRRFMRRHGESIDDRERFTTRVAEHVTEGEWLGNGSPYLVFSPDLKPITGAEVELLMHRYAAIYGVLADWSERQSDRDLDAKPRDGGRTARAVLLHVVGAPAAYLSGALGGSGGLARFQTAAERRDMPLGEALRAVAALGAERVRGTSREERRAVRERSGGARIYTLRKSVRRMLEHGWEHLAELSRRPGGPALAG